MIESSSFKMVNTSWMQQGSACWFLVDDKNKIKGNMNNAPLYVRGHFQKLNSNRTLARLVYLDQYIGPDEVPVGCLIRANNDYTKYPDGWQDLAQMNFINEAEFLQNLRSRFEKGISYTYADNIVVSCGIRHKDDIASIRDLNEYKMAILNSQSQLKDLAPHAFSSVFIAFTQLFSQQKPQQIIVTGISGSGKSANFNACLKLFSKLRDKIVDENIHNYDEFLNQSNQVLQAFGCGTTKNSQQSTRYYVNYHFKINMENRKMIGSFLEVPYVETSRLLVYNKQDQDDLFSVFSSIRSSQTYQNSKILQMNKALLEKILPHSLDDNDIQYEVNKVQFKFNNLSKLGFTQKEIDDIIVSLICIRILCDNEACNIKLIADLVQNVSLEKFSFTNFAISSSIGRSWYYDLVQFIAKKINKSMNFQLKDQIVSIISMIDFPGMDLSDSKTQQLEKITLNFGAEKMNQIFTKIYFKDIQDNFLNVEKLKDLGNQVIYNDNKLVLEYLENNFINDNMDKKSINYCEEQSGGIIKVLDSNLFIINHSQGLVEYKLQEFSFKQLSPMANNFIKILGQSFKEIFNEQQSEEEQQNQFQIAGLKQKINQLQMKIDSTHTVYMKCLRANQVNDGQFNDLYVLNQSSSLNLLNSLKMLKTGYPKKMSYQEYYKRYHVLDALNKRIPLSKHINSGTDMRALVIEMNRRLFQKTEKGIMIFGENYIYMKLYGSHQIEEMLQQWKNKQNNSAKIIQNAFQKYKSRKSIKENVRKLSGLVREYPEVKGQFSELTQGQEVDFVRNPLKYIQKLNIKLNTVSKQLMDNNIVQEEHLSDEEAYQLLRQDQKQKYREIKKQSVIIQNNGNSVAVSLLEGDQTNQYQKKRQLQGYVDQIGNQQQLIEFEISDQESYVLLNEQQLKQYEKKKIEKQSKVLQQSSFQQNSEDENEGSIAYSLLNQDQLIERQARIDNKELLFKQKEIEALVQEEGFLSDPESFALLGENQKYEYIQLKKEQQFSQEVNHVALSLLPQEIREQLTLKQIERQQIQQDRQKYQAMEDYLSDCESFSILTEEQKQIYKEKKLQQFIQPKQKLEQQEIHMPVSLQLLNQDQVLQRAQLKLKNKQQEKQNLIKEYQIDELSDRESYICLQETQKSNYKKIKQEKLELQKEINYIKYGTKEQLSDAESFILLDNNQKQNWREKKLQKHEFNLKRQDVIIQEGVRNISDNDAFNLLDFEQTSQYVKLKQDIKDQDSSNVAQSLLNEDQQQKYHLKQEEQEKFLEKLHDQGFLQFSNQNFIDSDAFKLLDDEQLQQRKQKILEEECDNVHRIDANELLDSTAYAQLNINQKEQRRKKFMERLQKKQLLNPIMFIEDIDPEFSIAYDLLDKTQEEQLYQENLIYLQDPLRQEFQNSLAYSLLNDKQKQERSKGRRQSIALQGGVDLNLDLFQDNIENIKNLDDLNNIQQQKIEKYEQDKQKYKVKGDFSDYEAFKLLSPQQIIQWEQLKLNENQIEQEAISDAFLLLDKKMRKRLRRKHFKKIKFQKKQNKLMYGIEDELSDVDSYNMMNQNQKAEYLKKKIEIGQLKKQQQQQQYGLQVELSDDLALKLLDQEKKDEWKQRKIQKLKIKDNSNSLGYSVQLGEVDQPQYILIKEEEELEKKRIQQQIILEEEQKKKIEELKNQQEENLLEQKKVKKQQNNGKSKRHTLFTRQGTGVDNVKADDFNVKSMDIWPSEATQYMKNIVNRDQKSSTIQNMIDNPDKQAYPISKNQGKKRLLDSASLVENIHEFPEIEEYDANFLEKVRASDFLTFCDNKLARNKKFTKKDQVSKIMKNSTDYLAEPLTQVDGYRAEKAKLMFKSLVKVGLQKKSRQTPRQHREKLLTSILGSKSIMEIPEPPSRFLIQNRDKFEKFQKKHEEAKKEKLLEDSDDEKAQKKQTKDKTQEEQRKNEKIKWNEYDQNKNFEERIQICLQSPMANFREEAYLQLCKQFENNKSKESVIQLLKYAILVSNVCVPNLEVIFPILNLILSKLDKDKLFKDPEINKHSRNLFRNLAFISQSIMIQNKVSEFSKIFPKSLDSAALAKGFDFQLGEQQLSEECKVLLKQFRILRNHRDPMIEKLFKISIGLNSISDIHYYQLRNLLSRKQLPTTDEQYLVENLKPTVVKIYLMSETPFWVKIASNSLVYDVKNLAAKEIGKETLSQFFGLYVIIREANQIKSEKFLSEDDKFLDILNYLEYCENIQQDVYKQNRTFQIYLRIKIYYRLFKIDTDSINLFYFQQNYEVQMNRFPVKPSDASLLAALDLYQKHGVFSLQNQQTTEQEIEKILDQLIPSKLLNGTFQEYKQQLHKEGLPTYQRKEWANLIYEIYKDLEFEDKFQSRYDVQLYNITQSWEYLKVLRLYDQFLSQQFQATYFTVTKDSNNVTRKSAPQNCILALRPLQIVITEPFARNTLKIIHLFDVNSWGKSEQGQNFFFIRNEQGSIFIFEFPERNLADYILNGYINWSLGKPLDSHLNSEFNDILSYSIETKIQNK